MTAGACRIAMAALAISVLASAPAGAQSGPDRAAPSVTRVTASDCGEGARVGTGFVWQDRSHVVTALHVVAGCQRISLYYEVAKRTRAARVVRVLKAADLALLQADNPPDAPPLHARLEIPPTNTQVSAIGYFESAPTMSSKSLKVALNSSTLKDMLSQELRRQIAELGAPSLDARILRLDGPLLPGLSGGPIVDRDGNVVGIASGGLKNGYVGVSWGIAAQHLEQLATAGTADTGGEVRLSRLFFSQPSVPAAPAQPAQPSVTCGGLRFTRVQTATIAELLPGSDDQASLTQIVASFGQTVAQVANLRFQIFRHLDTGASVAIPDGAELRQEGNGCIATAADGYVEMHVYGETVNGLPEGQRVSLEFEAALKQRLNPLIQQDPFFSYLIPRTRPDGLIVNRASAIAVDPSLQQPPQHVFETLMMRNNSFVGIATINRAYLVQQVQLCQFQPQTPLCVQLRQLWQAWMPMVIGTHLSTFPVY